MMTELTQYTRMRTFEDGSMRIDALRHRHSRHLWEIDDNLLSDIEHFEKNDCSGLGSGNCYKMGGW